MMSDKENLLHCANQVAGTCIANRVRTLNRVVSNIYNDELGRYRITVSQFGILTATLMLEPASPTLIATVLHLEKSSLSRNLRLMQKNGWIQIKTAGRTKLLSLTKKGKELYQSAFPKWKAAQKKSAHLLGPQGLQWITNTSNILQEP